MVAQEESTKAKSKKKMWKKLASESELTFTCWVELTENYNEMILFQISGDEETFDISIKMETRDNLSTFTKMSVYVFPIYYLTY